MSAKLGRPAVTVALTVVCGLVASIVSGPAFARVSAMRVGSAAELPLFAAVDGPLPAAAKLRLAIVLQPRDAPALSQFAAAVSTPGSPDYGRFLSVGQFARRFGASQAGVSAVTASLRRAGLFVGRVSANDLVLPVTGTARAVDGLMSANLARVALVSGRRTFANLRAPTLPAGIARYVQTVIGLEDLVPPQSASLSEPDGAMRAPAGRRLHVLSDLRASHVLSDLRAPHVATDLRAPHVVTDGPQPCSGATSESTVNAPYGFGYTADELAGAYQFSGLYQAGDLGAGQTVGVIEFGGYNPADVSAYQSCFGTSATVNPENVDGGPATFNPAVDDDGESALDIETVIGLAPNATVDVYQAPDTVTSQVDMLNAAVSQDEAKVISDSNGLCEAVTPPGVVSAEGTLLQEAASQGQSFFVSSGDSGSEQCSQVGFPHTGWSAALTVLDPASQPYATGVGGTTLFTVTGSGDTADFNGSSPSESVWNDGVNPECDCGGFDYLGIGGGGGGGISHDAAMPSYQSTASPSLGVLGSDSLGTSFCGQATCREVPDVAADASPVTGYVVFIDGSWATEGGTSAATPLWAAFAALTNADPTCRGFTIGFANPALYAIAGSAYAADFHDISTFASPTTGVTNNDTLDQFGALDATLNPNHLYPSTAGYDMATGLGSMIAPALAASLCSARAPVYTVTVTSPGVQTTAVDKAVSLQVSAADSGANATLTYAATGLPAGLSISSTGAITGTPTAAGTSTATVTASDQFTNTANTQFTWTVVTPKPPTSHATLSGLRGGTGKLTVKAQSGAYAPLLAAMKLTLPKGLSFVKSAKSLRKGITVKAATAKVPFMTSGHGGSLTLHFATPEPSLAITVAKPAISETKTLQKQARAKRPKKVTVRITVTDAGGLSTQFSTSLKL